MSISASHAFGYHSERQIRDVIGSSAGKPREVAAYANAGNFLGYIPLVGTVTGITKVVTVIRFDREYNRKAGKPFTGVFTARAVVEACSIGAIFIIPDAVVSASRKIRNKIIADAAKGKR